MPTEFNPFSELNVSKSLLKACAEKVYSNFSCSILLKDMNQSHFMMSPMKSRRKIGLTMFRKSIRRPCCWSLNTGMYVTNNNYGTMNFNWCEALSDRKLSTIPATNAYVNTLLYFSAISETSFSDCEVYLLHLDVRMRELSFRTYLKSSLRTLLIK